MKKFLLLSYIFVISFALPVAGQDKKLTILYTNDLHARVEPFIVPPISKTRAVGGFANIATLVKRQKAADPNTVYFDAGDYFTGPFISSLTKGEAVIDAMNYLGLDATCIGNHEFDHGWANARQQMAKAKFPILNGNIFMTGTEGLFWNHPYLIKKVNGVRIGVIGMHGKFAFYDTVAADMRVGIETRPEEVYLRKYIKELEGKADLIVVLTHEGVPEVPAMPGMPDAARFLKRDIDLAKEVPGIDIIVTGHAHKGTPEVLVSNGTLIVSTDANTTELGKLELTYNKKRDKIIKYTNALNVVYDDEVPDDPQMVSVVKRWQESFKAITDEVVTTASQAVTRSGDGTEGSPMGNMAADAMLNTRPGNDLAVTNSFGLRADLDAGPVTVGELISAFPFQNTVVRVEMKGSDLREVFEHGAGLTNGIVQVSKGVEIVFDTSRPTGNRIVECKINGEPLDDGKVYKVVTINYLVDGGDGYRGFARILSHENTSVELLQAMIKYLKQFQTYDPATERRARKL